MVSARHRDDGFKPRLMCCKARFACTQSRGWYDFHGWQAESRSACWIAQDKLALKANYGQDLERGNRRKLRSKDQQAFGVGQHRARNEIGRAAGRERMGKYG